MFGLFLHKFMSGMSEVAKMDAPPIELSPHIELDPDNSLFLPQSPVDGELEQHKQFLKDNPDPIVYSHKSDNMGPVHVKRGSW